MKDNRISVILQQANIVKKTTGKSKNRVTHKYLNLPISFDIETTSTKVHESKFAFMYLWQMAFDDVFVYGRTWDEFRDLLQDIENEFHFKEQQITMVIYVHNLAFEFQFFRNELPINSVFAVDDRKPIKVISENIEFRDSLILSGLSLEKTAQEDPFIKSLGLEKLKGDLDYSLVRHFNTPLTTKELEYAKNDVLIVTAYIKGQMKQYGDIVHIPMTNTSRVRQYCRKHCLYKDGKNGKTYYNRKYNQIISSLYINDENEYNMLEWAFRGGDTHANYMLSGVKLKNVASMDFTSDYPAKMVLYKRFPMSTGQKIDLAVISDYDREDLLKNKCVVFGCTFKNLKRRDDVYSTYLPTAKSTNIKGSVIDNGRIIECEQVSTIMTDVDFRIMKMCYTWEDVHFGVGYWYQPGYLPKELIECVLDFFKDKTTLKGVEDKAHIYLLKKGMLNSTYGMMVEKIIRMVIEYSNGWLLKDPEDKNEVLDIYNTKRTRFTFYPWGVYITAYARYNLWEAITYLKEDFVYCDTDSVKFLNYEKHLAWFDNYNKIVENRLKFVLHWRFNDTYQPGYYTVKGEYSLLGSWDFEGVYSEFKTLGAKRYIYKYEDSDKIHATIAGCPKALASKYFKVYSKKLNKDPFDLFDDGLTISVDDANLLSKKDMEKDDGEDNFDPDITVKNTHTYIDEMQTHIITDYKGDIQKVTAYSGVYLEPTTFSISLTQDYKMLLNTFKRG